MKSKKTYYTEHFKVVGKKGSDLGSEVNIDFDELEIIGDHMFAVAIPYNYSQDFKKNIFAALKAYGLGVKSIDNVRKKYGELWYFSEISEEKKELLRLLRKIKIEVECIVNTLASEYVSEDFPGLHIAQSALIRINSSFLSATLLISKMFTIECMVICRLILEQIGWSYYISQLKDRDKIYTTNPSKTIGNLKNIIPKAGWLYGWMNTITHLDPKYDHQYQGVTEDNTFLIKFHIPEVTWTIMHCLLTITDYYRIISELIFSHLFEKTLAWVHDGKGSLKISQKRPLTEELGKLGKKLKLEGNL